MTFRSFRNALLACAAVVVSACGNDVPMPTGLTSLNKTANLAVAPHEFVIDNSPANDVAMDIASDGSSVLVAYNNDWLTGGSYINAKLISCFQGLGCRAATQTIETGHRGEFVYVARGSSDYLL